jgi:hypothetical protein
MARILTGGLAGCALRGNQTHIIGKLAKPLNLSRI